MKANRYSGRTCPRGHTERYKISGNCVACQAARAKQERVRNKDAIAALRKAKYVQSRQDVQARADTLWYSCKQRAGKRGIPFDLPKAWVRAKVANGKCEATGMEFVCAAGARGARSPSIDRKRPEKGYTMKNCRVIVWALNAAIGTWGEAELRAVLAAWNSGAR